uniref:Uncharacterized protein n=1 Tax=Heterosigma akashiwo TaxID=2829 RepID=A0A6V1VGB7_HETAK|mmetsp:Transcript_18635/g.32570  ORF Transcript_18635/g.32570 Transcript_18635/m.32570 type:complete len:638 (+) Transcript_18635:56-1969(+)
MGCTNSKVVDYQVLGRFELGREITKRTSIGNSNMDLENVVVLTVQDFLASGRMVLFEKCAAGNQHVVIKNLGAQHKVLFVSHRWQVLSEDCSRAVKADDDVNVQFQVVKAFLESQEGRQITHVWLDLSCINQDRGTADGLKQFLLKLDNIGTAIACSHLVLVVPRLEQVEGQPLYFSNLQEYTERGWCLFEIVSAMMLQCRIVLGLVCGDPSEPHFEVLQPGPSAGDVLTLKRLVKLTQKQQQRSNKSCTSLLAVVVDQALAVLRSRCIPMAALLDQATECWRAAKDPAALLQEMHQVLDADLQEDEDGGQSRSTIEQQVRAATLTVDLNPRSGDPRWDPQAGKVIGALLPFFTAAGDREVVARLLINLLVLVRTAFDAVRLRDPEALRALVLEGLKGDRLDLGSKYLLPCEVAPFLDLLASELARQNVVGEGLEVRLLRLSFGTNPIGPHGAKALRKAAACLPPLGKLGLHQCGLGNAGALELAGALEEARPQGGALGLHLEMLDIGWNSLGTVEECGFALLAQALPSCPSLTWLSLCNNSLGDQAGLALAKALLSLPKLKYLYLEGNDLGDQAGLALAKALPSLPALEKGLNLRVNNLGEETQAMLKAAWDASFPDGTTRTRPTELFLMIQPQRQ